MHAEIEISVLWKMKAVIGLQSLSFLSPFMDAYADIQDELCNEDHGTRLSGLVVGACLPLTTQDCIRGSMQ